MKLKIREKCVKCKDKSIGIINKRFYCKYHYGKKRQEMRSDKLTEARERRKIRIAAENAKNIQTK